MNIIFIGNLSGCGGLSSSNRAYAIGLHDAGHYVRIIDIDGPEIKAILNIEETQKLSLMKERRIDKDFFVIHSYNPNLFQQLIQKEAKLNVFLTSTYTHAYPAFWARSLQNADQVWVNDIFNKSAVIGCGIDSNKLRVIPRGVDKKTFNEDGPKANIKNFEDDHFLFLSVLPWERKKGWDILIPAFIIRFKDEPRVTLLLKTWKNPDLQIGIKEIEDQIRNIKYQFKNQFGSDPQCHIKVIQHNLGTDQMAALYRKAHCYVAPIRGGEHYSSIMESMSCGTPVITTSNDKLDFLNNDNSIRFDVYGDSLVSLDPDENILRPWFAGHRWIDPNPDSLAKAMGLVYSQKDKLEPIRLKAPESIEHINTSIGFMIKYLNGEKDNTPFKKDTLNDSVSL